MSVNRQAARAMECPRCGDAFDQLVDHVRICMQCEGVWLATPALDAAFSDVRWPQGRTMWWRNSLECPPCKLVDANTTLTVSPPVIEGPETTGATGPGFELPPA